MVTCAALLAVDVATVVGRVDRLTIPPTAGPADVETWVIAGLDSRSSVPEGPDFYGPSGGDGVHADVIAVVAVPRSGPPTVLVVPRDMLIVHGAGGPAARLGVLPARGWDAFTSGMCLTLGIPVDHLVTVTMRGFADAVDALGGVEVTLPTAVRDAYSGLDLPVGASRLDGVQALSLVRSRHAEHLVDGAWVPTEAGAGALDRARWAGDVVAQLAHRLRDSRSPATLQRLAWEVSDDVALDTGTPVARLGALRAAAGAPVVQVPGDPTAVPVVVTAGPATREVLERVGFPPGGCTMG